MYPHNNPKTKLNEYCQRRKIPMPTYTNESSGSLRNITWYSTVYMQDKIYKSDPASNIKDADKNAAAKALSELLTDDLQEVVVERQNEAVVERQNEAVVERQKEAFIERQAPEHKIADRFQPLSNSNMTVLLVDLESLQPNLDQYRFSEKILCYCFTSTYSSVSTKKYPDAWIYPIDSHAAEAVDHYMTYFAARLSSTAHSTTEFVVVSRDKSSGILTQLLSEEFITYHFKNLHTLEQFLTSISM